MKFSDAVQLLEKYGIKFVDGKIARNKEEAIEIAERIGYPIVLKVISENIIHKTDVGGVKINLKNKNEVNEAFDEILLSTQGKEIEGILVQRMVKDGVELIVGGKLDQQFGPMILFGLGGVFVEVLKDVSVRICPIEMEDAFEMMNEIKGYPLLGEFRGRKGVDKNSLAELLVHTSKLLAENQFIKELDLNPVIAYSNGYEVVDVRIIP